GVALAWFATLALFRSMSHDPSRDPSREPSQASGILDTCKRRSCLADQLPALTICSATFRRLVRVLRNLRILHIPHPYHSFIRPLTSHTLLERRKSNNVFGRFCVINACLAQSCTMQSAGLLFFCAWSVEMPPLYPLPATQPLAATLSALT